MAFGPLAFGWPQPQGQVLPGSVPTPPNMTPFNAAQAPSYRSQTDTSEVALRAGGLPTVTPTQNRTTTASPPPMAPEQVEVDQVMQEGQDRPILNGIRSFAENLRSGPLSERIGQNRNAILGMGAALATPSGGVMGPNMGAFAANLSSGMQMDEQAAQQQQADEALTALFQSPDFAALPEQYRNLLMTNPELGRAFAMDMLSQSMAQAEPGWRQLTSDEVSQRGLDPLQVWQMSPDGQIKPIGDSPLVQIMGDQIDERPRTGTPAQGYQHVWDDENNTWRAVPIPGGTAERELQAAADAEAAADELRVAQGGIVLDQIDRALGLSNGWTTGIGNALFGGLPGTGQFDLNRAILTIKANIGFDRLQQMRDASPTGGALGQVAIQELEALQASLGSLDASQSRAQFEENLRAIRTHYLNYVYGPDKWTSDNSGTLWIAGVPQNGWIWNGGDPTNQDNWQRAQ